MVKAKKNVTNYFGAQTFYHDSRSGLIANNTYIVRPESEVYAVRLHQTNIVTYYLNRVILNSGGWLSVTTKDRMNQFTPGHLHVFQEKNRWFVWNR